MGESRDVGGGMVMIREIKFRGKRVDNEKWVYGYYSTFSTTLTGVIAHCIIPDGFRPYDVVPETVGQLTGLFDDTGTQIFEDDIVETQNSQETKTSYKSRVCVTPNGVLVDHHPAHIKMGEVGNRKLSGYCDYGHGGKHNVSCKIIGNIHDNPELIKGKPYE